jgi:hypothetical protein
MTLLVVGGPAFVPQRAVVFDVVVVLAEAAVV